MSEKFFESSRNPDENAEDLSNKDLALLQSLGIEEEDYKDIFNEPPFAEGTYALVFRIESSEGHTIIKQPKNKDRDHTKAELATMRLLKNRKYTFSPKGLGWIKRDKALFEESVTGEPLESFDEPRLVLLAKVVSKLHSPKLKRYGKPFQDRKEGTLSDNFQDNFEFLNKKIENIEDEEIKALLDKVMSLVKGEKERNAMAFSGNEFSLIHFDLNPNNILYDDSEGQITLIDWTQASIGDRAMDISKLFFKCNFDQEEKDIFLKSYLENEDDPDNLMQRIHIYDMLVIVNSVLWRIEYLNVISEENSDDLSNKERFLRKYKEELERLKKYV